MFNLVNAIERATNSQSDEARRIAYEIYQMSEGIVKDLSWDRFLTQFPARKNSLRESVMSYFVNIIKKYMNIKCSLYTLEPERDFILNKQHLDNSSEQYQLCKELLDNGNFNNILSQVEKLIHLQTCNFVYVYPKVNKREVGLKNIQRQEMFISCSPYEPEDIDEAELIYIYGATDGLNNPLYYVAYDNFGGFHYLDNEYKPMDTDPVNNKPYDKINPYIMLDEDNKIIPWQPFISFHEHLPMGSPFTPVNEMLLENQKNLNSMLMFLAENILAASIGIFDAVNMQAHEIPQVIGAGVVVAHQDGEFKSVPISANYKEALTAILNILRLYYSAENIPVTALQETINEKSADSVIASRTDIEQERARLKPYFVRKENEVFRKMVRVHNTYVKSGYIRKPLIDENISLEVIYKRFEIPLNSQSEAQALSTLVGADIITPTEALAKQLDISVDQAAQHKEKVEAVDDTPDDTPDKEPAPIAPNGIPPIMMDIQEIL